MAYAERGAYSECLRQARQELKEKIQLNCAVGSDASGDANSEAYQKCVEDGNKEQLSDDANKKCVDRAEATSGFDENQGADIGAQNRAHSDGTGTSAPISGRVPIPRGRPKGADAASTTAKPKTASTASTPKPKNGSSTPSNNTNNNSNASTRATPTQTGSSQDLAVAEIEADRDIASCAAAMSTASDCCNNPMNCSNQLNGTDSNSLGSLNNSLKNGATNGGLTGYCNQMNTLGNDAGNVNTGLSGICYNSHSSCSTTCGSLARKYKSYLDLCVGCEAEGVYANALSSLTSRQNSCDSLRGRSDQLALTGLGTANNQAIANYCAQMAGSADAGKTPSGGTPKSNSPFINNLLAANCEADPESADCKGVKDGMAGFSNKGSNDKDFNVPQLGQGPQGYQGNPATQSSDPGEGRRAGLVANNSGGQIPGAGNATEAKLGARTGMPQTQAGAATGGGDQGFRGGGGYSQQSTGGRGDDDDDDRQQYRNIAGNGSGFESVDLRQFLPGGSRARRLAGLNEINAKEENIFLRITNKMNEKCRLGVLFQCR